MRSDNLDGAEDQQERLIRIGWVVGFVDGEGCFSIGFVKQPDRAGRRGYRTGYQVTHSFVVVQGARSLRSLEELRDFFAVGGVSINRRYDNHKEHLHRFTRQRSERAARRRDPVLSGTPATHREAARLRGLCALRRDLRLRPAPHGAGTDRGRGDRADDESSEVETRPDRNPQRPYAEHPTRVKIWSQLHGDM